MIQTDSKPASSDSNWEQRWHPLLREWVIFSAHRQNRPWTGEQSLSQESSAPCHDPQCYLCPGNTRVSAMQNPDYLGVYVFDNDSPSISFDAPTELKKPSGIYRNRPATGLTRVICYSPVHNVSMAELAPAQVADVVLEWQRQTKELSLLPELTGINIFENKGEMTGMSNSHPHGQIYGTNFTYKTTESYLLAAAEHHQQTDRVLFTDIIAAESQDGTRIVCENETMIAFVPYFARFAYEVYVAPKRTVENITQLTDAESIDFASLLQNVLIRMDNLWSTPFPYLLNLHQAPIDGGDYKLFHFHAALYPPLRAPAVRKYVAAHEIGAGNFLADTMPEAKAAELRACKAVHYNTALDS